jgi:hypothetical protein
MKIKNTRCERMVWDFLKEDLLRTPRKCKPYFLKTHGGTQALMNFIRALGRHEIWRGLLRSRVCEEARNIHIEKLRDLFLYYITGRTFKNITKGYRCTVRHSKKRGP